MWEKTSHAIDLVLHQKEIRNTSRGILKKWAWQSCGGLESYRRDGCGY